MENERLSALLDAYYQTSDETGDGRAFIEVYTDSSMKDEFIVLSMYITLNGDGFTADIGKKGRMGA